MIAELFEAQAAATPLAVALRFHGEGVTYETLNTRANQLARYLKKHGIGREVAVGVCLPLGIDLVVAALAVAKAGAVYIGIDEGWPAARIGDVLDDSAVAIALGFADDSRATLRRCTRTSWTIGCECSGWAKSARSASAVHRSRADIADDRR